MNDRRTTARNTVYSTIGIYTEYVLGMLTSIVIARHLGPSDLGIYSLVVWMCAVGIALTNSGVATAMIKFVAELRGAGREALIAPLVARVRRLQRWFYLAVLTLGGTLLLTMRQHLPAGLDPYMFVLLAVTVGLRAPYMLNISLAKGFEDFRGTAQVALIAAPTNLMLVAIAALFDASLVHFLEVYLASSVLFYAISAWVVRDIVPQSTEVTLPLDLGRRLARHVRLVSVTVGISFIASSEVEILFLNVLASSADAGTFKVAHTLSVGAALLLPGVFSALLLPMMASAIGQGGGAAAQTLREVTRYLVLLAAPLAAFGAVFGGPIIETLYGAAYHEAGSALSLLLFGACLGTVASGANSLLVSADRQHAVLVLAIAHTALKGTLAWLLIPRYGLDGAVWASVATGTFTALATVALALRASGGGLPWRPMLATISAALLAALLALPARWFEPPPLALLAGALVFVPCFALLTVLLRCWRREDVDQLAQLHQQIAGGRPSLVRRALGWASARASSEP